MGDPNVRRHEEPDTSELDSRTSGQRDRDRVLYSGAFRRLAGVTQVVPPDGTSFFHNRLTHTLEVAQIGRRIGERLAAEVGSDVVDPDVVEAASLAHDLGHPPFGHIGEKVLDDLSLEAAKELGVPFDGFEGNAQSFRIVTKLSASRVEHVGLNLTRRSLNGILKYPWLKGDARSRNGKYGAFQSESDDFTFAQIGSTGRARSIEAQIMDYADEVAYGVHDVEDFYRVGLLPLDRLYHDREAYDHFLNRWLERLHDESSTAARSSSELAREVEDASVGGLFHELLFLLTTDRVGYAGTRMQRAERKRAASTLIGTFVGKATVDASSPDTYLKVPRERKLELAFLERLVRVYLIDHPNLATQQFGQRRVLRTLFRAYFDAVCEGDKVFVPSRYHEDLQSFRALDSENSVEASQGKVRVAVDIVASLSDVQAVRLYKRLRGIEPGAISDVLNV